MRVISGSLRGKKLASFDVNTIRPTSDRLREAIFNILNNRIDNWPDLTVLDLFAGTGALAIEALSRGAKQAVLVEQSRQSVELIKLNLRACRLLASTKVYQDDVIARLGRLVGDGPFDLIFLDPPYDKGLALRTMTVLSEQPLLAPDGVIVVETAKDEELPESIGPLWRELRRNYGAAALHLYSRPREETL